MRKFWILSILMMITQISFSQRDVIHLKDGSAIKCSIIKIDTSAKVLIYIAKGDSLESSISSTMVEYYQKRGFIDEKTQTTYGSLKESIADNEDKSQLAMTAKLRPDTPGSHFVSFSNNAQIGLGMMMVGSMITSIPWMMTNNDLTNADVFAKKQKTIAIVGAGITLVGFIVHLSSFGHTRAAGKLMDITPELSLNVTDIGIGLKFPINHK